MSMKKYGGRTPYEDENAAEIGEELTPDPFSDAPQTRKIRLSRVGMRTTPGKRGRLHRETPRNNRQFYE